MTISSDAFDICFWQQLQCR